MGEKFKPDQNTTEGSSVKVACSMADSKRHKITATARAVAKQQHGEMKAQLVSLDPIPESTPVKPEVQQKAVKEIKKIMASEDIKENETRIIVFDIGGQEVCYEILFQFLAVEDVALLVFKASIGLHTQIDPRGRSQKNQEKIAIRGMRTNLQTIEVLLEYVYGRGKKAPKGSISPRVPVVLMVGAHAEEVSIEEQVQIIQEIRYHFRGTPLLEHLPEVQEDCFYFIGNSKPDQKVVNHLRSTIVKAAQWVMDIIRPISYLSFEENILELKETTIAKTEAVSIARQAGLGREQDVEALLNYYTNKGILLYFPETESLKNEIFLCPDEVSSLVCTVITTLDHDPGTGELQQCYKRYQDYAILEGRLLDHMCSKKQKDKSIVLGLLQHFSLAAKVPTNMQFPGEIDSSKDSDREAYIIPSLLIYAKPQFYTKQSNDITVVYYFQGKFLPESIFNQLLVRTIDWCSVGKQHQIMW